MRWAVLELRPNFRKSVSNDPKWPWQVQGKKYQHACYIFLQVQGQKYQHACYIFLLCYILSYRQSFEKVHRMTPNDLDMFKVNNTHMHATNTPWGPTFFLCFTLQWAVFELWPNFRKSVPNDHDMFRVKNSNMHATYTLEAQIFVCFTLQWAVFELRPNIYRKVHQMTPNYLNMFKVKNTNIHATYTRGPNFVSLALQQAVFKLWPNLGEKCTQWPQNDLIFSRSKVPIWVLYTYPRSKFSSVSLYDEPFSRKFRFFNSPLVTI